MDAAENDVGGGIATAADPPPLNDTTVVTPDNNIRWECADMSESAESELKTDGLCPLDTTSRVVVIPAWE